MFWGAQGSGRFQAVAAFLALLLPVALVCRLKDAGKPFPPVLATLPARMLMPLAPCSEAIRLFCLPAWSTGCWERPCGAGEALNGDRAGFLLGAR